MTELPPIIERLDATLDRPDIWGSPPDGWRTLIESLRAELLRLQADRDRSRALLWEVDDAMRHNIYPNELYDRIRQHLEGHDEQSQ